MSDDTARQLAGLGKGLVQVNLRLNRITELLEAQGGAGASAAGGDVALELLLDLLDAVDRTLALPAPAPPRGLFARLFGPAPAPPDLSGLRLAREHVAQQLQAQGLTETARTGPVDPLLHRVVEVSPVAEPDKDRLIATTHRPGWHRPGAPPQVVRLAHVTAWRCTEALEASHV